MQKCGTDVKVFDSKNLHNVFQHRGWMSLLLLAISIVRKWTSSMLRAGTLLPGFVSFLEPVPPSKPDNIYLFFLNLGMFFGIAPC